MKGQYMVVESVTTVGLGVILAIGSITAFSNYQQGVMDRAGEQQAHAVESKIISTVYSLRYTESGSKAVDLPENIGSREYTVALGEKVRVLTPGKSYSSPVGLSDYHFTGSVSGGDVKVFKNGDNFTLRAN